jgi:hypothetical protein
MIDKKEKKHDFVRNNKMIAAVTSTAAVLIVKLIL